MAGGLAQVMEYLTNKYKAPSSNPSTAKKQTKNMRLYLSTSNPPNYTFRERHLCLP
jgi:hypothetical protein